MTSPARSHAAGLGIQTVPITNCAVKFTRPADQHAAAVIPSQLDGLRKRERLRDLYRQAPPGDDLGHLAETLGPLAGLDHKKALSLLTEFVALP